MTSARIDPTDHPLTMERLRAISMQLQAEGARRITDFYITPQQAYELRADFGREVTRLYHVTPPTTLAIDEQARPEMTVYGIDIHVSSPYDDYERAVLGTFEPTRQIELLPSPQPAWQRGLVERFLGQGTRPRPVARTLHTDW